MKTAIELIEQERKEQVTKHGFTASHDQQVNHRGQLELAAFFCLTCDPNDYPQGWDQRFRENILSKPNKERLIIAAALLAAEIDRLNDV